MEYITDQNGLIYTGVKLVGERIGIYPRNPNRKTKLGCKMRQGQKKKH